MSTVLSLSDAQNAIIPLSPFTASIFVLLVLVCVSFAVRRSPSDATLSGQLVKVS